MSELTFTLPAKGEARSASDGLIKTGLSEIKTVVNENVGFSAIRGEIKANGETQAGSGFSSTKESTGFYKISFTSEFGSPAILTATALSTNRVGIVEVGSPKKEAKFKVYNSASELVDGIFYFIALAS